MRKILSQYKKNPRLYDLLIFKLNVEILQEKIGPIRKNFFNSKTNIAVN